MKMLSLHSCASLLLLMSISHAAPIDKAASVPQNVDEVQNQEQELQSLLQLADEKGERKHVTVHEEHVQHVHEINGHKMEVDTARKTVSDTATGEVLSDVKQEVTKPEDSAGAGKPEEVQVKTEVDVPSEGVHETIVQSAPEEEVEDDQGPAMALMQPSEEDFEEEEEEEEEAEEEAEQQRQEAEAMAEVEDPEAVAEFLYRTGDFSRFYNVLAQLVNASIMTENEAQSYSELVAMEYDRLQVEDYENSIMVERRGPPYMEQDPASLEGLSEPYPEALPLNTQQDGLSLDSPLEPMVYPLEQIPRERLYLDPYELISALWQEAYGTGDVRAQALVGELFDRVRSDNDPDDEGQVRDILLDMLATVMDEEEQSQQPLYGWQTIMDQDTASLQALQPIMDQDTTSLQALQPMEQPLLDQPIREVENDEEAANELLNQSVKRASEQPSSKNEETNAAPSQKEQPMESGNTAAAATEKPSQPMEKSETKEEQQPSQGDKSAPVSAQKRAAEHV